MAKNIMRSGSAVFFLWVYIRVMVAQSEAFPVSISMDPPMQIPHGLSLLPQIWSTENPAYRLHFIQSGQRFLAQEAADEQARLLKEVYEKLNDIKYIFYADRLREASRQILGTRAVALARGQKIGYDVGANDGTVVQTKTLGRSAYALKRLQGEDVKGVLSVPMLDYAKINALLQGVDGRWQRSELPRFGAALLEVNMAVISALNQALSLSHKELALATRRYGEIHPPLARLLYCKYIQLLKTQNTGRDPNFYAFPNYTSADKFNFLVRGSVTSVLDAVYSYVLEDWGEVARRGLKAGGGLNIAVVQIFMPRLEEQIYQMALEMDYEAELKLLTGKAKHLLRPLTVETRQHTEQRFGTARVGRAYKAYIGMDIKTILKLRFKVEELRISLDHCTHTIKVTLPDDPKILDVVLHDYVVRNLDNFIDDCCGPAPSLRKTKLLPEYKIRRIFRQNRTPVKSLDIATKPLDSAKAMRLLEPYLQKLFEPSLARFHSTYQAVLQFGATTRVLIPANPLPCISTNLKITTK